MLMEIFQDLTTIQLVTIAILAFVFCHKLGFNKPYYLFVGFVTQVIVDICTDQK
jgi:hypothetical protein